MSDFDATEPPRTVGDLRRRLESMGQPWSTLPGLTDDDPLPQPARGGLLEERGTALAAPRVMSPEEFDSHVREVPPTNPFLAGRWQELGVLPADSAVRGAEPMSEPATPEWGVG
jgi:hypothetical protein